LIDSKSEWFNQTNVVFQQVLEQVTANLNEIHSVHYSTRYWNIFMGSWLQRFVHMVMFRLYEIESNKEISISTCGFSPANTLVEFAELAKTPMFVERLHAEVLEQMNVLTSPSNTEKHSNNEQSRPNAKLNKGRTYVSATYLPRLNEVLLQLRLGRLPQRMNTSQAFAASILAKFPDIAEATLPTL
jgi:hypothetical protein